VLIKEGNFQVVAPATKAAVAGEPEQTNAASPKPDYIIEGSLEMRGAQIHLIVQVLSTMDSSYVWSESADCEMENLACVEDLARSLTRELQSNRS
jgi:TolB-like protein